ncbi:1329_t:CDS:2 [Dentiscutata erythropus]|uniref:1329_t:CDS:1 n=1 Tax=Dentiscutata erythropus TaxID=1348616 RepID=A0A9N9GQ02_9GLOM|nr:1329_t:CDS:2 [Dentiscutata erythropus]
MFLEKSKSLSCNQCTRWVKIESAKYSLINSPKGLDIFEVTATEVFSGKILCGFIVYNIICSAGCSVTLLCDGGMFVLDWVVFLLDFLHQAWKIEVYFLLVLRVC